MEETLPIIAIYVTLFVISLIYNRLVGWLEEKGLLDGLKGLLVIGGAVYTTAGIALRVNPQDLLFGIGAVVAALIPMVWGDVSRNLGYQLDKTSFWQTLFRREVNGQSKARENEL